MASMDELISYHWNEIRKIAEPLGYSTEQDDLVEVLERNAPKDHPFIARIQFSHGYLVGAADACNATLTGLLDEVDGLNRE